MLDRFGRKNIPISFPQNRGCGKRLQKAFLMSNPIHSLRNLNLLSIVICTPNTGCPALGVHIRKRNCYDNCIMEIFFGRLKTEMFYGLEKTYTSFEIFAKAITEYIDYYNKRRIQVKTKWMLLSTFREASMAMT